MALAGTPERLDRLDNLDRLDRLEPARVKPTRLKRELKAALLERKLACEIKHAGLEGTPVKKCSDRRSCGYSSSRATPDTG